MDQADPVKAILEAINQMQADGVIGQYAMGGAVGGNNLPGAYGHSEHRYFCALAYDYLKTHGGTVQDEHVVIGGWPVQFLPPSNDLENEAIAEARPTTEGVETRAMLPVAIALNTGRTKDHIRILQFVEQDAVDRNKLVLERHGMVSKWRAFGRRFMEGTRG